METIFAYIDPGSGSLVIQALIAGMVAIPIFFRAQISRAIRSIRGSDTSGSASQPSRPDDAANGA